MSDPHDGAQAGPPEAVKHIQDWYVSQTPAGMIEVGWREPDGTFRTEHVKIADLIRMVESQAELVAALRLMLVSVDYIMERYGLHVVDSQSYAIARAALAKAKVATP